MQTLTEQRQSARPLTRHQAWIVMAGRPRLGCLAINLSTTGACLQLRAPPWLPSDFQLHIDGEATPRCCKVRHVGAHGVGVKFHGAAIDAEPAPRPDHDHHASLDWLEAHASHCEISSVDPEPVEPLSAK